MPQLGRAAGLNGVVELCREGGIDAAGVIDAAGLPRAALTDPDLRLPVEAMAWVFEEAARRTGFDDFGLRVAERRTIANMGALGLVIREQPTLRRAIEAYARYQWLQNSAYSLHLADTDRGLAVLKIGGPAWQQRQVMELSLATCLATLRGVVGDAWRPQEAWFIHKAPERLQTHRRVLGVTPLFEQDCIALVVRSDELDRPLASADPAITRHIAQHFERLTEARNRRVSEEVQDLIVALLPEGLGSADEVAVRLGMDRRTLHRRLSAEGQTFSSLLDLSREDMAAALLADRDRPLRAVADILGFSSLSAFAHWFRRKFHQSATAFRTAQTKTAAGGAAATPAAGREGAEGPSASRSH